MHWARKATGSAAVILDEHGRALLVRRAYPPGDWVLPGGNAEERESPTETVVREVAEETGLRVTPQRLTAVYYQADHLAGEFIHFVFRCARDPAAGLVLDPAEVAEAGYFAADALPEPMSETTRRRLVDGLGEAPLPLPVELPPGVAL